MAYLWKGVSKFLESKVLLMYGTDQKKVFIHSSWSDYKTSLQGKACLS